MSDRTPLHSLKRGAGFMFGSVLGWFLDFNPVELHVEEGRPRFPAETIEDLNGRRLAFPTELPGERTLALVTFVEQQQGQVDQWIDQMNLRSEDAPAWVEIPVLSDLGGGFKHYMDGALRQGIEEPGDRSHVFALYTRVREFCSQVGLPSTRKVYALVVDRRGRILAQEEGLPTPSAMRRLRIALRYTPSMGRMLA